MQIVQLVTTMTKKSVFSAVTFCYLKGQKKLFSIHGLLGTNQKYVDCLSRFQDEEFFWNRSCFFFTSMFSAYF